MQKSIKRLLAKWKPSDATTRKGNKNKKTQEATALLTLEQIIATKNLQLKMNQAEKNNGKKTNYICKTNDQNAPLIIMTTDPHSSRMLFSDENSGGDDGGDGGEFLSH